MRYEHTLHPLYQQASLTSTRALNFGDFKDGKAQQPLPPSLTQHESEISGFANLCNKTCNRILNLLALGLEVHTQTKPNLTPTPTRIHTKARHRSQKTSSPHATTQHTGPQAVSCATCTTHQSSHRQQQPTSTTKTCAPAPTPTTAASRCSSSDPDSRGWRS